MQNRYTGDVGDFGKFGLLRALCGTRDGPALRLGVLWYLVPDESHNKDGKHIRYLDASPQFRDCDPELYDGFRELFLDGYGKMIARQRRVSVVEGSGVLPPGTVFFNELLHYRAGSFEDRLAARDAWVARAVGATAMADVVFVDPDNGIECQSVTRTAGRGPKYVFWDEIGAIVERGQTAVVYHHLNRTRSTVEQVRLLRVQFDQRMPGGFATFHVIFRRGTRRAYFIAAAPAHRDILARRLSHMLTTPWARHFVGTNAT
jgi:hypothetical protein